MNNTNTEKLGKVIQPAEIFTILNIKNPVEAERVMTTVLYLLLYMNPGDKLETSVANFEKLTSDLIHIDYAISPNAIVDELYKKRIIKLPI